MKAVRDIAEEIVTREGGYVNKPASGLHGWSAAGLSSA